MKTIGPFFFAFLPRWIFLKRRWWLQECFLVEGIQVLILLASAWPERAQRSPCHHVQGLSQASSPYSGAFGFQCCFLGWAGHFLLQALKLQNDKRQLVGTQAKIDPLRLRDHALLCFSFKKAPGRVVYSPLRKKLAAVQGSRGERPRLEFQLYYLVAD